MEQHFSDEIKMLIKTTAYKSSLLERGYCELGTLNILNKLSHKKKDLTIKNCVFKFLLHEF